VPQFLELLNKPDNEAKCKSSLEDMKQSLAGLDKKLQQCYLLIFIFFFFFFFFFWKKKKKKKEIKEKFE